MTGLYEQDYALWTEQMAALIAWVVLLNLDIEFMNISKYGMRVIL